MRGHDLSNRYAWRRTRARTRRADAAMPVCGYSITGACDALIVHIDENDGESLGGDFLRDTAAHIAGADDAQCVHTKLSAFSSQLSAYGVQLTAFS